jgi:probable phosphoglycerate mutase
MALTRVIVVRHGQSTWNAVGRWQGHADAPLSELGRSQAASAVASLPAVAALWTSDLARALETAEIIGAALGVPIRPDARFRERDAGDWTGLTRDQIEAGWPRYLADHRRPNGFEVDSGVLARVLDGLADVHREHPGEMVLIVSHGGVLRAMERYCNDVDRAFPNLGGRVFDLDGSRDQLSITARHRLFLLPEDEATFTTAP